MAIDPRQLKPSVLTRMLNSTPLGEVISERQLRRHRNRAGYRIGDDKHIDLLRYAAWLMWQRHNPEQEKQPADYESIKEAARARNAELSAIGRDIGDIPEVIDTKRKARAWKGQVEALRAQDDLSRRPDGRAKHHPPGRRIERNLRRTGNLRQL